MPRRVGELTIARELRRRRSVILGGHGVADVDPAHDPENLCVAPARFRAQVELLLAAGFEFRTVAELARESGGRAPRPGLVALSFDDGMQDNHAVLLPILREYGLPATVYVVTGLIGEPNPWLAPAAGARMMNEAELRELHAAGVELGAHTVTHPDLSLLDLTACTEELAGSRAALEERLGAPVRTAAYPFFRYGPAALEAARAAGFEAVVTGGGRGGWAPLELRRAMITGRDGTPAFLAKLAGVYEPVFSSRLGTAARGLSRRPRQLARVVAAARSG